MLSVAKFGPFAKKVKAGKRYSARLQVHRCDLGELTSADTIACKARVGKRPVPVRAACDGDTATCSGKTPKFARGKRLKVKLSVALDGVKVSRTASIRVRR